MLEVLQRTKTTYEEIDYGDVDEESFKLLCKNFDVIQKLKGVKLRCIEKGGWTKESMLIFYEKCSAYKG
jgi:hypothetical protein